MNPRLFVRLDEDPLQGPESGAPRGTLQAMAVCPELRPYVSHILVYREAFAPGQEVVERVVPDGAVRLVANLGDPPAGGPALQVLGPSAAPALVRLGGRVEGLSITLQPGAAPALLGVPAGELAGTAVALDDLWNRRAADLLGALAGQPDDAGRADVLQAALRRRLPQGALPGHLPAVHAQRLLAASAGRLKVRDAAAAVGVGERRLQQLFMPTSACRRAPGAAWRGCTAACARCAGSRTRHGPTWPRQAASTISRTSCTSSARCAAARPPSSAGWRFRVLPRRAVEAALASVHGTCASGQGGSR